MSAGFEVYAHAAAGEIGPDGRLVIEIDVNVLCLRCEYPVEVDDLDDPTALDLDAINAAVQRHAETCEPSPALVSRGGGASC